VLPAVGFNDQTVSGAREIDDKTVDRMLTSELVPRQAPAAQREPQPPLCTGLASS
jgi:hypothetical protein